MNLPSNIDLPFFAYGIFKPGQPGFFQLREFVGQITSPIHIHGKLLLRDGLPILDTKGDEQVKGVLLHFVSFSGAEEGYKRIAELEPEKQYRWETIQIRASKANVLAGRYPNKGTVSCEDSEWNGWNDPLFTSALEVINETLNSEQQFQWNLKPMFRLQMAYLLLWSAIERYTSLRYHLGNL